MQLSQSILIFSTFMFGLMISLISLPGTGQAAPPDNAACNVKANPASAAQLKVTTSPKPKAELGTTVQITATVNTSLFQRGWNSIWGELRLCIQDPKTNNWSQKKPNWSLAPPKPNYTYAWQTCQAGPNCAQSNPGRHAIKIIAINNSLIPFLAAKNLYAETSITLETKEIVILPPPVPPTPDPGSGGEGGEQPQPGPGEPLPPSGPDGGGGQPPGGDGSAGGSTSPLFGAQAVRDYFAGLANPQSIPDLVTKIITFLLGMIAFAAFAAIIIGGIQYMTSLGSEEKAATAKRTIVYAVIGVIISMSLITIISVISRGLNKFF